MSSYDPNVIIQAAHAKLASNDFEGGQMMFQSALLTWVDDAREGVAHVDPETIREAVATLWLAYANFLATAKQFKSATEAYEQAVQCPVASQVGRVWLEYARFAEDRGKLKTAQKVYVRALMGEPGTESTVMDEQDQSLLWSEFLEMMKKTKPDLTLPELKTAVQNEQIEPPSSSSSLLPAPVSSSDIPQPPSYVSSSTVAPDSAVPSSDRPPHTTTSSTEPMDTTSHQPTHVVTAESVEEEANAFGEAVNQKSLPPDLAANWMIRDGTEPAQPPDPPLFEASPPKLADPTAKDILGVDLAYQVIERVMSPSGNVLLEVCRGLWSLQGLLEKKSSQSIKAFDESMKTEFDKMESTLESRLSVAGENAAIVAMNDNARMEFKNAFAQQRQSLVSGIAWEFRNLLCIQQQILTKLQVPSFEGPTVDSAAIEQQTRVCSYLHSAFFLRNRVGEEPHLAMLKGHLKVLQKEKEKRATMSPVPPSFSNNNQAMMPPQPVNNTNYNYGMASQVQYQQQQQSVMGMMGQPEYGQYAGGMPMTADVQMQMHSQQGQYPNQQQQQQQQYPPPQYY